MTSKSVYRVVAKGNDGNTYEGRVRARSAKAAKRGFKKKYGSKLPAGKMSPPRAKKTRK